ncbi:MAG TPA: type IV secretory system conjugative DNA transfer family protein [Archangium sp.]|nr:type IV secretory system conjugative DNA transfer family protein [Archangium sp.]
MACAANRAVPGKCPTCGHGGPMNVQGDSLLHLVEGNHWCLLGRTGRGKSYLLKDLMRQWLELGHPVVAWDPEDELSQHGDRTITTELGPLRDRCTVSELLADPDRYLLRPDVSVAIVPDNPDEEDAEVLARQFIAITKWVRLRSQRGKAAGQKPLVLVLEEVGAWANPDKPPATVAKAIKRLTTIATRWRKRGMVMMLCAQIMPLVPRAARSQVSKWVVFQLPQSIDRNLLGRETSDDFAALTEKLDKGEFMVADVDGPRRMNMGGKRTVGDAPRETSTGRTSAAGKRKAAR